MGATPTTPTTPTTPRKSGRSDRSPAKLRHNARLLAAVLHGLELEWSPQQISHRLRLEHPEDEGMRVSHETI